MYQTEKLEVEVTERIRQSLKKLSEKTGRSENEIVQVGILFMELSQALHEKGHCLAVLDENKKVISTMSNI